MTATQAAMIMMSGSADLEDITITENGEYESVDHDGFGVVTVEVPTMVECAEEVAEILGVDTSQEWNCDDIKAKAQEVVDENEEMQECCDGVLDVIHDYDPTYDPHPDPPDPTNPTIPEKIQEIIDEESGYTFPSDNSDPDRYDKIAELVGGDPLTDNDLHIIVKAVDDREPPIPSGQHNVYYGFYDSVTRAFIDRTQAFQSTIDPEHTDYVSNFHITDPSTGAYTFDWVMWGYLYNPPEWGWKHYTYTGTSQNLIGYGDPTHSYTVKNK